MSMKDITAINYLIEKGKKELIEFYLHTDDYIEFIPDRQIKDFTQYSRHQFGEAYSVADNVFGTDPQSNIFSGLWTIWWKYMKLFTVLNASWDNVIPFRDAYENICRQLVQKLYNRAAVLEGP